MAPFIRSLRSRIALAFVVWTALIQVTVMLTVPPIREHFALGIIDSQIMVPATSIAADIGSAGPPPRDLTQWALNPAYQAWGERLFLQMRDPSGDVVGSSRNLGGKELPFDSAAIAAARGGPVYSTAPAAMMPVIPTAGAGEARPARARVITVPVHSPGSDRVYFLQVARSMAALDNMTDVFYVILLFVTTASTLGGGVAGWAVAGHICARLERVASSVRRISPTNLDERLELSTLPDEIGRLAADVNVMLERLAQGFRSQERFISDVSHELKTPVAVLLTEAQALKMGRAGMADYQAFVLSVEDEMRRLGKLVESFLMLARFGHGRRFLGEMVFQVNDVALDSVQHSKMLAAQHGVGLALTLHDGDDECDQAVVHGDPELVRTAIDNLIRNAIQYSKRGDTVSIAVACTGGSTILTVEDQGRGVAVEYLDAIFDRFAQAPGPTTTGRRGTGLGLAIAKGVVDLHRGTIRVRNRAEGGCAFTVTLPIYTAPGAAGHSALGERPQPRGVAGVS